MIEHAAVQKYLNYLVILEQNNREDVEHDDRILEEMDFLWNGFTREEIEYIDSIVFKERI